MQTINETAPKTVEQLLAAQDWAPQDRTGTLLRFKGVEGRDVYNPSAPFRYKGTWTMAARVEDRARELGTTTQFFCQDGPDWVLNTELPTLPLQDPFVVKIAGQWVVGGVYAHPSADRPKGIDYETHLYVGSGLSNLEFLMEGPPTMKDVRPVELPEGIAVLTRPQGKKGGRGQIGFVIVPRLEDITADVLLGAPIIPGLFTDEEWGGANEAHRLPDGRIGIIGHVARFTPEGREYYAMAFVLDPHTLTVSDQQIIATSDCFSGVEAKRPDLERIVFPSGIGSLGKKAVTLYCGLNDTAAGVIPRIPNPFYPNSCTPA